MGGSSLWIYGFEISFKYGFGCDKIYESRLRFYLLFEFGFGFGFIYNILNLDKIYKSEFEWHV